MREGEIVAERFRIEREAGRGGMGTVYRALDALSGEAVALKVMRDPATMDVQRFVRESALLASLAHPGIVRHVAHGTLLDGAPWLAMEWLEGEPLSARIARGTLPVSDAIRIARGAADALGAVHARGVVHRDVKPANLFLIDGDPARVKLLDLGIARRMRAEERSLTATGTVMGTPFYMAPEQARGLRTLDARADVYALGCVLHEMLAGTPPFTHESMVAVLAAILLERPTPLSSVRSDVPPEVEAIVLRLLEKDAALRPRDGAELAQILEVLRALPEAASPLASLAPRALTEREQRVVCVVLVEHGASLATDAATMQAEVDVDIAGALRSAAEANGGRVEQLVPGALLVTAGEHGTPMEQAARAARIALALAAIAPHARIAVAAGRAELRGRVPVGNVVERGASLLGDTEIVHRDARSVRIDAIVAGLLDGRFVVEKDVRGHALVGLRREVDTGRLLLGKQSPFVGRDRELASLAAMIEESREERVARVALIVAGPGVGKSRLLSELARRAESEGTSVLVARGDPLAAGSPFLIASQLVRAAAGITDGEPLDRRRARLAAHVEELLGPSARRTAALLGEIARTPWPAEEDDEALRAARRDPIVRGDLERRAFEDWLGALSERSSLLIALDDAHLGDRPSIALCDAALRNLADRPIVLVALGRPELDDAFPELFAERDPSRIALSRLLPRAARTLVRAVLGESAPEERVTRIVERADGNPFFLEEMVRAAAEGADDESAAAPTTVLGMVEARLSSLDGETRRVLRAASVFGMRTWRAGIAALLGSGAPLDDHLRDLVRREILSRASSSRIPGEEELAFRAPLVREAAYATLTEGDRALGHRLAGEWLEGTGEHDALVLAEHFDRGGASARAAGWYARAAEDALAGDDLRAVVARADRGIASDSESAPLRDEVRAALWCAKATAHRWRGEYAAAKDAAERAMQAAPEGSARWLDAASTRIAALGQLGLASEAAPIAAAIAALDVDADAVPAQIVALCRGAALALSRGATAEVEALLARADVLASTRGSDALASAWMHALRASAAMRAGDLYAFVIGTEAAVLEYERAGDTRDACNQRVRLANAWTLLGAPERAEPVLRRAEEDARRMGTPLVHGYALQNLGHALALSGRDEEARAALASALSIADRIGDRFLAAGARLYRAELELTRGSAESAVAEAEAARALIGAGGGFAIVAQAAHARALLAAGAAEHALREASAAAAALDASPSGLEEGEALVRLAHAEALAALGRRDEARSVASAALDRARERAARIAQPEWRASFVERVAEHARLGAIASGE